MNQPSLSVVSAPRASLLAHLPTARSAARLTALVVGLLLSSSTMAYADNKSEAQLKFDEGRKAYEAGKVDLAREAYRVALTLDPRYDIAANLATTELALGDTRAAAEHFDAALRALPADAGADKRAAIEGLLAKARASLVTITVAAPEGAQVLVDAESVGVAPLPGPIYLSAAPHELAAKVDDRQGPTVRLEPQTGSALSITLEPPAEVLATPMVPGTSTPEPSGTAHRSNLPIYIGAGLSVAAVGLGVASVVIANGHADNVAIEFDAIRAARPGVADRSLCYEPPASVASTCADLGTDAKGRDTWTGVSVGAFIGGGVLALGTVAYALFWPSPRATEPSVAILPTVGAEGGGLHVIGAF